MTQTSQMLDASFWITVGAWARNAPKIMPLLIVIMQNKAYIYITYMHALSFFYVQGF